MAFKRRRFGRRRKQLQRWTANQLNTSLTANGGNFVFDDGPQIVLSMAGILDYQQAAALEPKAAVHTRSILHLSWGWRFGSTSNVLDTWIYQWKAGILVTDLDATNIADLTTNRPNPADTGSLIIDDWIWTKQSGGIPTPLADEALAFLPSNGATGARYWSNEMYDITAKRKLDDKNVLLLISLATTGIGAGDNVTFDFQLESRTLLGGNF